MDIDRETALEHGGFIYTLMSIDNRTVMSSRAVEVDRRSRLRTASYFPRLRRCEPLTYPTDLAQA